MNLFKYILLTFVDLLHGIVFILPLLFLFNIVKNILFFKIILGLLLLIPLHWPFFDGECIVTLVANRLLENESNKSDESYISRQFLFIPKFFKKYFKNEFTPRQVDDRIAAIILITMLIICWYIIFYKIKCVPKIPVKKKKTNFFL